MDTNREKPLLVDIAETVSALLSRLARDHAAGVPVTPARLLVTAMTLDTASATLKRLSEAANNYHNRKDDRWLEN
jgi:hypothetical protein